MSSDGLEDYVRILKIDTIVVKDDGIELFEDGDFLKAVIKGNTTVEKLQKRFPDLNIVCSEDGLRSLTAEFLGE